MIPFTSKAGALLAAATTAGLLVAGAAPAPAAVDWNACGQSPSRLHNTTKFTTETRGMNIQVRTHFRRSDGTVAWKTSWVDKGFAPLGTVLAFEATWAGSHPEVAHSISVWREVDSAGRVHRAWRSDKSRC